MRRRDVVGLVGGAAAAWPLAARAQQDGRVRRIGFLSITPQQAWKSYLTELNAGLAQAGFVEGQNVKIDFQVANGRFEQMTEAAAELVSRQPAVILAISAGPIIRAAKAATDTIPIIFTRWRSGEVWLCRDPQPT